MQVVQRVIISRSVSVASIALVVLIVDIFLLLSGSQTWHVASAIVGTADGPGTPRTSAGGPRRWRWRR